MIHFTGLGLGDHSYHFKITDEFFEQFEYSEVEHADIDIDIILEKQPSMLILDFDIRGNVDFICDRCQESFTQFIQGKEQIIIKFGQENIDSTDEIIVLPLSENKIDLSQHIFEYINLLFPYRRVHPDDIHGESLCNKEMIERLKSLEKTEQTDPRWDILKNISL